MSGGGCGATRQVSGDADLVFEEQNLLKPEMISSWAMKIGFNLEQFQNGIKQDVLENGIKENGRATSAMGLMGRRPFF